MIAPKEEVNNLRVTKMHAIMSDAWGGESCGTSNFIQKYINIWFLAYQASPLCGDKDNESNSNFDHLYHSRGENTPSMKGNGYTSFEIESN